MTKTDQLIESSITYPHVVYASDGFRVIRCKDNIQFIAQKWKGSRWRNLSYHMFWRSLHDRHKSRGVPRIAPESPYKRGEAGIAASDSPTHLNGSKEALTTERTDD